MGKDRLREISSMGGKRAHQLGLAHKYTPEEARAAGRLGGNASRKCGRCRNPGHRVETCPAVTS